MKVSTILPTIASLLCLFSGQASSHTWVDELQVVGGSPQPQQCKPGYTRNYLGRVGNTNIDRYETYRFTADTMNQNICPPHQQQQGQKPGFPYLTAYKGNLVVAKYLENGHISIRRQGLDGDGDKNDSGTMYWFMSFKPNPSRTLPDVMKWTMDGKGGNKEGMLLSKGNFDDGKCIENGKENLPLFRDRKAVPCTSYFRIPEQAKVSSLNEIIMVWDFSCKLKDPKYKEYYSGCMDIMVADSKAGGKGKNRYHNSRPTNRYNSNPYGGYRSLSHDSQSGDEHEQTQEQSYKTPAGYDNSKTMTSAKFRKV